MASIASGFDYDIFISYRQKDNKFEGWVANFVSDLKKELAATFKEDLSIYFDENLHDGLSENHDVDLSLREKVKCLVFIPIISRTYCDPKSFAWRNEFLPFLDWAQKDQFGLKVKVANGNVSSRALPVRIHDLDHVDLKILEGALGGTLRAIDFTFKSNGINRPLLKRDKRNENFYKTIYRDQINKVANAVKEILDALKNGKTLPETPNKSERFLGLSNTIPTPATTLFGRSKEMEEVVGLLKEHRVVSIMGTGGMGKTRLALELSHRLKNEFLGNIVFVSMTALTASEDVIPTLANAMGIKEAEGRNLTKGISSVIGDRRALLVLDNLEQVIAVAPQIAELVSNCSNLSILTTSRTPLKIQAEYEYSLTPLSLPSDQNLKSVDSLMSYPSVSLFLDRARKVNAAFQLTAENAQEVVQICRRLDGLPLALELAAARIRMMSAKQLLQRLEHALDVLTGGSKDLPERHQTLRATIDWSYSLLGESEKTLFRRMAVFPGGCTLEGIEATCYDDHGSLSLEELESLVEKGLVQRAGASERFTMLQTIKEYAIEKLDATGETYKTRLKQAMYYVDIATSIGRGLEGKDQLEWMKQGILEEGNIQSVLDFLLLEAARGNAVAEESGLMICGELIFFWHIRGKHIIARHYTTSFLNTPVCPPSSRGKCLALNTAGLASSTLGHSQRSLDEHTVAYEIAKQADDKSTMTFATLSMFIASLGIGKIDDAGRYVEQCLALSRDTGSDFYIAFALTGAGIMHTVKGELDAATKSYDQALSMQTKIPDHEGGGLSLGGLALLSSIRGNYDEAIRLYKESLAYFGKMGDRAEQARILEETAWVFLKIENAVEARKYFLDSILAYEEIGSVRGIGLALLGIAGVEAAEHRPAKSIKIATAAELFTEQEGIVNFYGEGFQGKVYIENARKELSKEALDDAIEEGRKLSLKDTLQLANSH